MLRTVRGFIPVGTNSSGLEYEMNFCRSIYQAQREIGKAIVNNPQSKESPEFMLLSAQAQKVSLLQRVKDSAIQDPQSSKIILFTLKALKYYLIVLGISLGISYLVTKDWVGPSVFFGLMVTMSVAIISGILRLGNPPKYVNIIPDAVNYSPRTVSDIIDRF